MHAFWPANFSVEFQVGRMGHKSNSRFIANAVLCIHPKVKTAKRPFPAVFCDEIGWPPRTPGPVACLPFVVSFSSKNILRSI